MKNLNRREDDDYDMLRAWRDNTLYMDIPKDVIYGMNSKRCDLWYSMDIFWNGPGHMEKKNPEHSGRVNFPAKLFTKLFHFIFILCSAYFNILFCTPSFSIYTNFN